MMIFTNTNFSNSASALVHIPYNTRCMNCGAMYCDHLQGFANDVRVCPHQVKPHEFPTLNETTQETVEKLLDKEGIYYQDDKGFHHIPNSALDKQVAGDHYKNLKIQPIEYIHANGIPFAEGSVIKYVTRWRDKGGIKDLEKAKHFIELLIEMETRENQSKV
jgi:hypothetical protein